MGYARYVGRVGALAVALGIGVALANGPATAWADGDEGSSSGSASSASDSSSGADSKSDSSGPAGSTGASSDGAAGNASPGADGGTGDAAGEDADDDGSTDAAKENDESGADDAAAGDDSTSDPGQPAGVRKGSRGSHRESVTPRKSEVKVRSEAVPSAKRSEAATTVSNTPTTAAGGTAPQAVSASETRRSVPISTPLRSADVVDVAAVSTAPREPAKTVTTALLSALGLSPLATGGPADAPDSPVAWAMFAALRRQTDEDAGTEQKLLSVADPVASTMSVEEPMMAMAAVAAVASAPVVGSPDQGSGAVLVGLNPVGPSGNPLTYTVTSQPVNGAVAVVGASATYTPTVAARLAAGSTAGVDFDSFAVSDGQTSTSVSVPVLPAVWVNEPQVSNVTGASPSGVALVGDLAYVANQGTNTVTVINTKTGAVVGSPIVVGSAPTGVLASADGSKVFVTNRTSGTVSVIRTLDNTLTEPITVGTSPEQMALNSTGTKLYVTNYGSSNVSVVDVSGQTPSLVTNIAVGANPRGIAYATVNGQPRVYVTRYNSSSVAVIDANTNMQIDVNPKTKAIDSITVGANPQAIVISPGGTRAYVTNFGSSSVSVINTATNSLDGAAISVGSQPAGVGSSDGSLLYVANSNDTVSVINTKTRATVATLQIDSQPETNYHTLAVRSDGALVVTDLADQALRVLTLQRGNTAPVPIANPSVGAANPTTGAVSGSINIKDWDGDALTFTTVSGPSKGSVTFNAATDTYTYTPTQAARDAAVQTPATDTFTIRATDPYGAYKDTTPVTVAIAPTPISSQPGVTPIAVGPYPNQVVVSGTKTYVFNAGDYTVSVIDTTTNQVIGNPIAIGRYAEDMASAPTGNRVYITHVDSVSVINTTNNSVTVVPIPVRQDSEIGNYVDGIAVSRDGSRVYIGATDGTITVLNGTNNAIISNTAISDFQAGEMEVSADGNRLYALNYTGSSALVVDTATMSVVKTITPGNPVFELAISPGGKRMYTTGWYGAVSVIDTDPQSSTYHTRIATITVPDSDSSYSGSWDVAFGPDGSGRAYVTQADGKTVSVIDTATNTVLESLVTDETTARGTQHIAVAGNGIVYVADAEDGKVYAVNVDSTSAVSQQAAEAEFRSLRTADPSQSSLMMASADAGGGESMLMAAEVTNSAPTVSPVVGSPDQATGAVRVSLNATDADGNPLTYSVPGQPTGGTLRVDGAGVYTYTPSVASRLAATTSTPDFDSFTVSVADGQGGVTPVTVSVPKLPAVWANEPQVSNVTGASPSGVALVGDLAYVANQGTNTVTVINTKTGAVVGSPIVVGSAPTGVLASADGSKVFVTNRTSGTVSVIRTLDNTLTEPITVGTSPEQMALNSTGTKLYVTNYGSSNVSVVDVSGQTPSLVTNIAVGANPRGIAYATVNGQPRVYVTRYNSSSVAVIDANTNMQIDVNPKTKAIDSITVGANPQAIVISPGGTRAYVTNFGSSSVSVINTATNSLDGAAISVGSQPAGVGLSSDGSLLYVANSNDTVSVINTKTRATVATLQIDSQPETNYHTLAVRSDGALVVTDLADQALRVLTLQRGNTAPVPIANPSVGAANPTTGAVSGSINIKDWDGDPLTYSAVVSPTKGSLTFDAATGRYTYTPTMAARQQAAQNPNLTDSFTIRATDSYGAYKDTASITVPISPTSPSGTIPSTITPIIVGFHPGDVVFSGHYAYVANYASGNVSVIDTRTNSVVDTVPVVGDSMAASADGTRLYVTRYSGVAIVDPTTNDIIWSVDVPLQYSSGVQTAGSRVIDVAVDPDDSSVIYALRWYTAYEGPAYYYGSVSRIDTDTSAVTTVNTAYLRDIEVVRTPAGTRLYGGQYTGDVVKAYNAATLADVGTIDVSDFGAGSYVTSIATSPDGKRVYALVSASDGYGRSKMISVIDTATNREIATIADPSGAIDVSVSPDSKRVYVAQYDGRTTLVIDPLTNTVSGNFTTDQSSGSAQFVAEAPNGKVYVTDYDLRTVYAVNVGDTTPSNNVTPTWRGPTKTFNPATGVTTGNVNVGDGDGDALKYYVSSPWLTYGTLTLDENTGDYVYTSYGTNDGYNILYEEAFTVVVTDGHYTTTGTIYVQTYVDPYSLAW